MYFFFGGYGYTPISGEIWRRSFGEHDRKVMIGTLTVAIKKAWGFHPDDRVGSPIFRPCQTWVGGWGISPGVMCLATIPTSENIPRR